MPDLEGDDLKKLHEHLEKLVEELGVEEVKRMLVADRFPTRHYLPIAKWLRKKEASKASPEGPRRSRRQPRRAMTTLRMMQKPNAQTQPASLGSKSLGGGPRAASPQSDRCLIGSSKR